MPFKSSGARHTAGGSQPRQLGILEADLVIAISTTAAHFGSGGYSRGTFQIPAAFTGATIQPAFGNDGTNFTDSGGTISVSTDGTYAIPAACFAGKFIRLTSASSEAAARTLKVFLKA